MNFPEVKIEEKCVKGMALSTRYYTIIKVFQAINHQGDIRYGVWWVSRGVQCSCMSLISVSWTLFKSPGLRDKFDLYSALGKMKQLFRSIGKYRYLGMKELLQAYVISIID